MKKLLLFLYVFFLSLLTSSATMGMPIMPVEDGGMSNPPPSKEKVLILKIGDLIALGCGANRTSLVAGAIRTEAYSNERSTLLADPAYVEGLYFWEPAGDGRPLLGSKVVYLESWSVSVWPQTGYWTQVGSWIVVAPASGTTPWNLPWPAGGTEVATLASKNQREGKVTRCLAQGKFRTERGFFSCVFTPAGDDSRVDCQSDLGAPFPVRMGFTWMTAWSVKTEWYLPECDCWGDPPGRPLEEGEEP